MITLMTSKFVVTVDELDDGVNSWYKGRVRVGGHIIWESSTITAHAVDVGEVMEKFAHELAELFHEQ